MRRRSADLLGWTIAAFRALFSGSPVKRVGRDRFLRNVLIAAGNSAMAIARRALPRELLDDASPLVRGAAVWALSRLLDPASFEQLGGRLDGEADRDVRTEWTIALSSVHTS
jgi:epoxyqueuosine reductase